MRALIVLSTVGTRTTTIFTTVCHCLTFNTNTKHFFNCLSDHCIYVLIHCIPELESVGALMSKAMPLSGVSVYNVCSVHSLGITLSIQTHIYMHLASDERNREERSRRILYLLYWLSERPDPLVSMLEDRAVIESNQ